MEISVTDSLWVLVSAFLVFFMHAGFALVEAGFCRRKNAVMVLTKNVAVVALASIAYYAVGFGFMFGEGNGFIGLSGFFPAADAAVAGAPGNLPLYVFLFFQLVFAATAATIVSGAVAERAALLGFFIFTTIATVVVYPIVGHWIWGGGWLATRGFVDFAGSTAVHAVGGAMALAGAVIVGPRIGKYTDSGVRPLPGHNVPLATLGVVILWLGWFGFNGGSTLSADPNAIAPVVLVTLLSAAAGFLVALSHVRIRTGMFDLSMALNGALGGLVGITAGCAVIGPLESMIVGALAGVLVVEGVFLLDRLRIDDPVGTVPVHGVAGIIGTLAVGLFANSGETLGLFHGGGAGLLATQALGTFASALFAGGVSFAAWAILKATVGVRVSPAHEREGLDLSECGIEAYGAELSGFHTPEPPPVSSPGMARSAVELSTVAP